LTDFVSCKRLLTAEKYSKIRRNTLSSALTLCRRVRLSGQTRVYKPLAYSIPVGTTKVYQGVSWYLLTLIYFLGYRLGYFYVKYDFVKSFVGII
jgi:hypothetical protein